MLDVEVDAVDESKRVTQELVGGTVRLSCVIEVVSKIIVSIFKERGPCNQLTLVTRVEWNGMVVELAPSQH